MIWGIVMNAEFVYLDTDSQDVLLEDEIAVLKAPDDGSYFISNSPLLNAQIVAPEIDFYFKNTTDDTLQKAKNVTKLYNARATGFDLAKDVDYEELVNENVIVVSESEEMESALKQEGFKVVTLSPKSVKSIEGHLGALDVVFEKDGDEYELQTAQIVWKNAPEFALKQSGVVAQCDVKDLHKYEIEYEYPDAVVTNEEVIAKLKARKGEYHYKNYINYDSSICQYHERRGEYCGRCADVCPTVAVVKLDDVKHLKFSHIDCHGCGGCISVCPSGALDYSQMPRASFKEIAELYKERIALVIPEKMDISNLNVSLPNGVLPFKIEGEKYLHEAHYLTLLQTSGAQIVFYTDFLSIGTRDAIGIVNQIYQAKYGKDAILVCENEKELQDALQKASFIENSYYETNEANLLKREIFANRLSFIVGEENLGVVQTGEKVRYGKVLVDDEKCTLCSSCVGACNVGALVADEQTNSLLFNPSLCTTCGYCIDSCAEKCMSLKFGELELRPETFEFSVLAKDTIFECVECHKPLGTTKAIMKVAQMMEPLFGNDELKIKTLYCCADCKAKLMATRIYDEQKKSMLGELNG